MVDSFPPEQPQPEIPQDQPQQRPRRRILASEPLEVLQDSWPTLQHKRRVRTFQRLSKSNRLTAEELFLWLSPLEQQELLNELPWPERRSWLRLLAPDDAADLIQQFP